MNTPRAQDFIELIDTLKNIGTNGHFELLLFTQLNAIDKPFADITVSELITAAKFATELQTGLTNKPPVVPQAKR